MQEAKKGGEELRCVEEMVPASMEVRRKQISSPLLNPKLETHFCIALYPNLSILGARPMGSTLKIKFSLPLSIIFDPGGIFKS